MKYPKIPLDKNNPIRIEYENDPLMKENQKLEWRIKTPQFQSKRNLFMNVLDDKYPIQKKGSV